MRKIATIGILIVAVIIASMAFNQAFGQPKALKPIKGIAGLPTAPEGKVVQYVVNCGGIPGCPAIFSMSPIYTNPDELGFNLKDPESKRQYQAALNVQQFEKDNLVRSGRIPELLHQAYRAKADAALRGELPTIEAESAERTLAYHDAYADATTGSVISTPGAITSEGGIRIIIIGDDPGGCTFGNPCDSGSCGTIIDGGSKWARCIAACINCRRL